MNQVQALDLMLRMRLSAEGLLYHVEVGASQQQETTLRLSFLTIKVELGLLDQDRDPDAVLDRMMQHILALRTEFSRRSRREDPISTLSDKEEREVRKLRRAILKAHQERRRAEEKLPAAKRALLPRYAGIQQTPKS